MGFPCISDILVFDVTQGICSITIECFRGLQSLNFDDSELYQDLCFGGAGQYKERKKHNVFYGL
jgi:hypothetical protein